ncbi:MAG: hypothetical protein H6833_07080 [Planctomycetes bacterium]|nr:hypothetical protein [Planctomycetota bacterium]
MKCIHAHVVLALCFGASLLAPSATAQFEAAKAAVGRVQNQLGKIRSDQPFDTSKSVAKEVASACQAIESAMGNCGKSLTDERKSNVQRAVAIVKGQAEVTRSATITWHTNLERGNSLKQDADIVAKQAKELTDQWKNLESVVSSHRSFLHDTFKSWHGKRHGLLSRAKSLKDQEESLEKQVASQWRELQSAYAALQSAQAANQQAADAEDEAFQRWQAESVKDNAQKSNVDSLASSWNSAYERSKSAGARALEARKRADALDAQYDATLKKWTENEAALKAFFGASDLATANLNYFQYRDHVMNFEKEFKK